MVYVSSGVTVIEVPWVLDKWFVSPLVPTVIVVPWAYSINGCVSAGVTVIEVHWVLDKSVVTSHLQPLKALACIGTPKVYRQRILLPGLGNQSAERFLTLFNFYGFLICLRR